MIWVTSDFHFGHEKEFLWRPRGFESWQEAAEQIIKNYNEVVDWDDTVYILGDCVLKNDDFGLECLKRLKGNKFLAFGNHDTDMRLAAYTIEQIFCNIQFGYRIKYGKYSFWMCHHPMKMGNYKEKRPVWNLSGHTHQKDRFENAVDGIYNVSLDAHDNYPVSIDKIVKDIKKYHHDNPIIQPRCEKCVYEMITCHSSDTDGKCEKYKRDPPDGGYYG